MAMKLLRKDGPTPHQNPRILFKECHCFGSATLWHLVTGLPESGPSNGSAARSARLPLQVSAASRYFIRHVHPMWDVHESDIMLFHPQTTRLSFLNVFMEPNDVSGCLNTLPPEVRAGGFHKVPPRFHQRFHQGSPSFVVSLLPRKVPPRLHQGFTKVPPKSPSFLVCLALWGRSVLASSWPAKRFPGRSRQSFTQLSSSFLISLVVWGRSILFPEKVVQRVPHSKGVSKMASLCLVFCFFAANGFRLPQRSLVFIPFRVFHGFWGKRQLLQKRFWGAFPQLFSTFVSQMAVASEKVLWRVPPSALCMYLPVSMLALKLCGS